MTLINLFQLGEIILALISTNDERARIRIREFDTVIFELEKTFGPLESQMSNSDYKFVHIVYEAISKFEKSGCLNK